MTDAQLADRIDKAYIRPIRTVLAIDDEFPLYGSDTTDKQIKRATAIWQACRNRGLLCDIDDGASLVGGGVPPQYVLKSDLIILDYHLQEGDARWALELLVQLAESDHASLVVVYTKDKDIEGVRRKIAAHLRGRKSIEGWLKDEDQDAWKNLQKDLGGVGITEKTVDAFIGGRLKELKTDELLRKELVRLGVPQKNITSCLHAYLEWRVHDLTQRESVEAKAAPAVGKSEKSPWVYANNLFVVCVNKTPENVDDGELVFRELRTALCEWKPNFMYASLAFARAEFVRGGFRQERAALNDPKLQAGWLYHAWAGSEHERKDRLRTLFERVITGYAASLLERVIEFGGDLVPTTENPDADMKTLRAAIQEYNEDGAQESQVMHLLNSFLVIESNKNYIETGTIFVRKADADLKQVYICVTPACDLVPRIPKDYLWESEIHPSRPIIAIRCKVKGVDDGCLNTAEQGKNVFITIGDELKTLVIMDGSQPVPILEWFVVEKMGETTNKEFDALDFVKSKGDEGQEERFAHRGVRMRVLGQVRAIYASRLQQYAGQHLSRIGVDFVGLPDQPKGPKKEKPAAAPKTTASPAPNAADACPAPTAGSSTAKPDANPFAKGDAPPPRQPE